ncbi:hypothetical protein [Aquiflexum lacus]|uniref:hypothetical protein n=1 Tax=Aquiflexum lacus TaxID=2483805 RepID=UPI0018935120|nr:hypothetical protein [Aquiflexum lacus]
MREAITLDRIANSIIQRRKKFDNFILVEGSHDRLFFLKFKNNNSQIEITFGWEKLIAIIKLLKDRNFDKVIGIIDKDLRDIIPENSNLDDEVILTDDHDINVLCLEQSFNTIFNSYCSLDKVEKFKDEKKTECLKEYTHNLLKPLSYLKILNKREGLHLCFKANDQHKKNIDYSKFIDKNKYELIALEKLVETITNYSRGRTKEKLIANEIILNKLKIIIKNEDYENSKLNCGHDFGEVICLGLKKVLGTKEVESEAFLKENILAYEWNNFITTDLYKKIRVLENKCKTNYLRE